MQIELLNRRCWSTVTELSAAMAEWICDFYNPIRRHSALGYLTPNEYEALHSKESQSHSHKAWTTNLGSSGYRGVSKLT